MKSLAADLNLAVSHARKAGLLLLLPIGIDAVFFIVYGFVRSGFFEYLSGHLGSLAVNFMQTLSFNGSGRVITIALLAAASLFFVYSIFQSIAWWLCHRFSENKISYSSFLFSFVKLSSVWAAIFFVHSCLSLYQYVRSGGIQSGMVAYLFEALLIVIFGVAAVSYSTRRMGFVNTFKAMSGKVLPGLLVVGGAFSAVFVLISLLGPVMSAILQFAVVLPLFTFSRLFLIARLSGTYVRR